VEKNLAGAFNRFEQHLALQQAQGLAEAADMAARKKRTQQLFVERLGRDAAQKVIVKYARRCKWVWVGV
jgi:hypothetical protein